MRAHECCHESEWGFYAVMTCMVAVVVVTTCFHYLEHKTATEIRSRRSTTREPVEMSGRHLWDHHVKASPRTLELLLVSAPVGLWSMCCLVGCVVSKHTVEAEFFGGVLVFGGSLLVRHVIRAV